MSDCSSPERVGRLATDEFVLSLARSVAGKLGGKVGIAPRLFLKKLVSDVLDRIDQFDGLRPEPALPVDLEHQRDDRHRAGGSGDQRG